MIKKLTILATFALLGVLCAVAAHAETVRGEGRYVEQTLTNLTPFNAIEVRGDAQVDIWQRADDQSVSVNGKQNLVALADIRVENNTLIVDFKRPVHIKGSHALHVTITTPQLTALAVHSNGRVRVRGAFEVPNLTLSAADHSYITGDSVKTDVLRVQAMNQAEIDLERLAVDNIEAAVFDKAEMELSGHAKQGRLTNNGSEELDASDLRIEQAQVAVNAKGDIEVFATHTLKAHANGSGKIEYHGRPTLTRGGNINKIQPAFND